MLNIFNKSKGKSGLVGIYFTQKGVSLAHVSYTKNEPELLLCSEFSAESSADKEKELVRQVEKLGLEETRASYILSPSEYKLFLVEAPSVSSAEMESAVKWKIKDLIDGAVDEMAITVFPVPDDAYRGETDMVYAVASRKTRIREIVDLVQNAGLQLDAIDIPELVMKNLSTICADDSNGLAFLDLRGTGSTLNVCRDGAIYLTRHLRTRMDSDVMNSTEWGSIREKLVLEIQRSLDYYESQLGQSTIPKIVIAPRHHDSQALADQLNETMAIRVECMNITEGLKTELDLTMEVQQSCMLAIGGALRQEQAA